MNSSLARQTSLTDMRQRGVIGTLWIHLRNIRCFTTHHHADSARDPRSSA